MKPVVYIETSVVSYLTSWLSRDPVIAVRQQLTRKWFPTARRKFRLVMSDIVIHEAGRGDPTAARERLIALEGVTPLDIAAEAERVARELLAKGAVPAEAAADAYHIAVAATNPVHYLVTWNLRHIANAAMRSRIERVCRDAGYEPPVICTPEHLMETSHETD